MSESLIMRPYSNQVFLIKPSQLGAPVWKVIVTCVTTASLSSVKKVKVRLQLIFRVLTFLENKIKNLFLSLEDRIRHQRLRMR